MTSDEQRAALRAIIDAPRHEPPQGGRGFWGLLALIFAMILGALVLSPRPEPEPAPLPPPAAETRESRPLETRLASAGWSLARGLEPGPTRRLPDAAGLVGAEPLEEAPWFVLLTIRYDGWDEHCGGTLLAPLEPGGRAAILTAAHCVMGDKPWRRIDAAVAPTRRGAPGRARYVVTETAFESEYEGLDAQFRHDRALIFLPDDPGGGLSLPLGPWAELKPGMAVEVVGMGLDETGRLSERLKRARLPVVEARPGIVRLDGAHGGFRQADSGGPVLLPLTDGRILPVGVVSHFEGADPARQWIMSLQPERLRKALKAALTP